MGRLGDLASATLEKALYGGQQEAPRVYDPQSVNMGQVGSTLERDLLARMGVNGPDAIATAQQAQYDADTERRRKQLVEDLNRYGILGGQGASAGAAGGVLGQFEGEVGRGALDIQAEAQRRKDGDLARAGLLALAARRAQPGRFVRFRSAELGGPDQVPDAGRRITDESPGACRCADSTLVAGRSGPLRLQEESFPQGIVQVRGLHARFHQEEAPAPSPADIREHLPLHCPLSYPPKNQPTQPKSGSTLPRPLLRAATSAMPLKK